jgi:HSP20 family protein
MGAEEMANSNMTRWNPFREMAAMQNALDRMFDDSWRTWGGTDEGGMSGSLALDVHEDDSNYIITTALPGVDADNINIRLHNDMLTIEGEIPERTTQREGQRSLLKERYYGRFSRTIRLPQSISRDNVEAAFDNGVLTLTLPKSPESQPRTIQVKSNKQLGTGENQK